MQAQRQLRPFEAGDEQPALFDLFQPLRGPRVLRDLPATRCAQLRQHRAAQQEVPQLGRHVRQHLSRQVVEHMAVERRRAQRAGGGTAIGQRVQRQAQAHRPALCARQQLLWRHARGRAGRGLQQRFHLAGIELQIALAELGQLALHAQPGQGQRRRVAAAQHQHPVRGQAGQQQVQKLEHARVLDAVQVVEHDHAARRFAGGQHVEQLVGRLAALRARAGDAAGQHIGIGAPGRVEGLQCRADAGQQPLRVVVLVAADPGQRTARRQPRELPRQRRGLAETGRGDQQHQPVLPQRCIEPGLQRRAGYPAGARPGCLDLGARKTHRRRTGAVFGLPLRPPRPESCRSWPAIPWARCRARWCRPKRRPPSPACP